MPPLWEVYSKYKNYITTMAVIRLHGPDRAGIEKRTNNIWDKIQEPKDDELIKIREMILSLLQNKISVFVNVNNHYEGSAPLTIEKLKGIISPDA
jgi:uncharacterized protein YecE (DUF72 family)